MTLNIARLKQLGLLELLQNKNQSEIDFEKNMAAKLRALTFQYLKGELTIQDGDAVKELRNNLQLNEIDGLVKFVRKQSPNKAWATDVEMTLLAELLDVNVAVKTAPKAQAFNLSAHPSKDKATFVLINRDNVHWNAELNGVEKEAIGDGNCGYNSMALLVKAHSPIVATHEAAVVRGIEDIEALFSDETDSHNRYLENLQTTNPADYEKIKAQIEADYQCALQLFLDDLPGIEGKPSSAFTFQSDCLKRKDICIEEHKINPEHSIAPRPR